MAIGIVYNMSRKILRDEITVLNLDLGVILKWVKGVSCDSMDLILLN